MFHYVIRQLIFRRGLTYTYPGSSEPALKNVSFSLEAGETLAIVGYNGSGMSYSLYSSIPMFLKYHRQENLPLPRSYSASMIMTKDLCLSMVLTLDVIILRNTTAI